MTRVVFEGVLSEPESARRLRPRSDLVVEREDGPGSFSCERGPFSRYRRTVQTRPVRGGVHVTDTTEFQLAAGVWNFLFVLPIKRELARAPGTSALWWAPPDLLDRRAARSLSLLASLSLVVGYLGTLLTQTITFAVDEFDATNTAQGSTLASVRAGILLALVVTALADRRGRRLALVGAAALSCGATVAGALAPGLVVLGATQTISRGSATAVAILIAITAAEEMPAGSRAYAVSLLAMSSSLGAGLALVLLPLADLGEAAWRVLYLVPLAFVPAVAHIGRALPESRRYRVDREATGFAGHGRRFWLLAASAFLGSIFLAPASQFLNEYLRDERGFSAAQISLFSVFTNLPGGIGIVVAGRLADVRGRRVVGAVGMAGGVGFTVLVYLGAGWSIWAFSALGALIGAATIPALGVYGPELFPTSLRGRANGVIGVIGVVGSGAGLLAAGVLSEELGEFGPALALLAIGPAVLSVLILLLYPETARRELEEINPGDLDHDATRDPGLDAPRR